MNVFLEPLRINGRGHSNPGIRWVEKWVDREIYLDALGENKNLLPLPQAQGLGGMTKELWFDSWQRP
jgi:hypothetical protein